MPSTPSSSSFKRVVRFRVNYKTEFGENLRVVGSHPVFGSWNPSKGFQLKWTPNDNWEGSTELAAEPELVEYKYVVFREGGYVRWEEGRNRTINVLKDAPNPIMLDDIWENVRVTFIIYFPTQSSSEVMHITGDPTSLGAWFKPGPVKMQLGETRRLPTGVMGRCWELSVELPRRWETFAYRYLIMNLSAGTALWEREPNRQALIDSPVNGSILIEDVNFVGGHLFDYVPEQLFIGPYPQQFSDIDKMHAANVTAVFNVQTDEDMQHRQVNWSSLVSYYQQKDILVVRYPIRDFNAADLEEKLMGAASVIEAMVNKGHNVYIHCTAGMGRAPASAVAFLVLCRGMPLEDAVAHVKAHRTVAVPNIAVLQRVTALPYQRTKHDLLPVPETHPTYIQCTNNTLVSTPASSPLVSASSSAASTPMSSSSSPSTPAHSPAPASNGYTKIRSAPAPAPVLPVPGSIVVPAASADNSPASAASSDSPADSASSSASASSTPASATPASAPANEGRRKGKK